MQKGQLDAEPELRMDREFRIQDRRSMSDVAKQKDRQKHSNEVTSKGLSDDAFFESVDNEDI